MIHLRNGGTINMSIEELNGAVSAASGLMKMMTGIGNNSAWAACLDALDHIRKHPNFKQQTKQAYKAVLAEFQAYERNLLFARNNRLFHLDDMMDCSRKRYGDISDKEYFEYWAATGATVYSNKREWFTNVWNKFRIYLIAHNVKHPDIIAWTLAGGLTLRLATDIYEQSCNVCCKQYGLPRCIIDRIFSGLSLERVSKAWDKASILLEPYVANPQYTETDKKNIQYGIDQLQEQWTSPKNIFGGISDATEAFDEIFRTKGEKKKALKGLSQLLE